MIDWLVNGIDDILNETSTKSRNIKYPSGKPSHEHIAEAHTKQIDSIIIRAVRMEMLDYVGGKFYFELSLNGEYYRNGMELYFRRRSNGEWVRKQWRTAYYPLNELLLDSVTRLKKEKKIEYDVTNPLEEA